MKIKEFFAEHRRLWLGLSSVLFVLAAWEMLLTYVFPLNPFFFTKPSLVAVAFKEQVIYGALWGDLAVSSKAFLWGFSFAVLLGIPLGALMGWRRTAGYTLDPFFTALYASPLVALAPLIIVVFGVGLFAKSVLVFALSVFPFIFNTFAGVRSTEPGDIEHVGTLQDQTESRDQRDRRQRDERDLGDRARHQRQHPVARLFSDPRGR